MIFFLHYFCHTLQPQMSVVCLPKYPHKVANLGNITNKKNFKEIENVPAHVFYDWSGERKKHLSKWHLFSWVHIMTKLKGNKNLQVPNQVPDCCNPMTLERIWNRTLLHPYSLIAAILEKNVKKIKQILQESPEEMEQKSNFEMKPIQIAIELGDMSIVECLIDQGAQIDYEGGESILMYALRKRKYSIVKSLIYKAPVLIKQCYYISFCFYKTHTHTQ